jgi:DNA-binding transcriptional regulator YdaS (Cro superfamily)
MSEKTEIGYGPSSDTMVEMLRIASIEKWGRWLELTPATVRAWFRKGEVPIMRALQIEEITRGFITRLELRPDIFDPGWKRRKAGMRDPGSRQRIKHVVGPEIRWNNEQETAEKLALDYEDIRALRGQRGEVKNV